MAILEYELHFQILLMLYLQATFKGWMDIMYAAVDSVNVSIGKHNTELFNFEKLLCLVRLFSNSSSKKLLVRAHTLKNIHMVVASVTCVAFGSRAWLKFCDSLYQASLHLTCSKPLYLSEPVYWSIRRKFTTTSWGYSLDPARKCK